MKTLAVTGIGLVSLALVACGALAPSPSGSTSEGVDGGTNEGGAVVVGGETQSKATTSACSLTVGGVAVTNAPATIQPGAILGNGELTLLCSFSLGEQGWGSFSVGIPDVTAPGTYQGKNAYYETYSPADGPQGYSSHDPQNDLESGCSVVVDSFAPRTKGGMSAHFSCPRLAGNYDEVTVEGTLALPARAGNDAGAPPDAGGLNEAGAPSCVLHAHGDYEADTVGVGNNYQCNTYAPDGTSFSFSPGATTAYLSIGAAWCPTCGIEYTGACTTTVELDEGDGGRYVASFSCKGLSAGNGTSQTIDGRIDGMHVRPPE
jgi:hypothetical protein